MTRGTWVGAAALLALALSGCSSGGSGKSAPTVPKTTTTVESAETRQWGEAAARGVLAGDDTHQLKIADGQCLGHALVDTLTVARLKAAGTTLTDLSDPNYDIPKSLAQSLSLATKSELGGALQACHFGQLLAPTIAESMTSQAKVTPTTQELNCIVDGFDAPARRLLVGEIILGNGGQPSASEADGLATILSPCVDWAAVIAPHVPFKFAPSETSCIDAKFKNDPDVRNLLADGIAGIHPAQNLDVLLGARMIKCLTDEHLVELAKHKSSA
jgi:hypothetical protein